MRRHRQNSCHALEVHTNESSASTSNVIGDINSNNITNINNITNNNNITINITPWGPGARCPVTRERLAEVLATDPRLVEYCGLPDDKKFDLEISPQYAGFAVAALLRTVHRDCPELRNMRLCPDRQDLVAVFVKDLVWSALCCDDAFAGVCREVAEQLSEPAVREGLAAPERSGTLGIGDALWQRLTGCIDAALPAAIAHLKNCGSLPAGYRLGFLK